jgi:N utilization substance protein B
MSSARHRAREFALQGLYQWQVSGNEAAAIEAHMGEVKGFDKADRELFSRLLRGAMRERDALRDCIAPHLDRKFEELSPVERGILLLGTFELAHEIQTPYRVVLNEAIELAKSYGGTEGHRYVNGVLDKVAAQLRPHEAAKSPSRSD